MNSASCQGNAGVSDTFASALWALDTLFNFASGRRRTGSTSTCSPALTTSCSQSRTPPRERGRPSCTPSTTGCSCSPRHSRRAPAPTPPPADPTKVWATAAATAGCAVVAIDQDATAEHDVSLPLSGAAAPARSETLKAPSGSARPASASAAVVGAATATGTLPAAPATTPVTPRLERVHGAPGSRQRLPVDDLRARQAAAAPAWCATADMIAVAPLAPDQRVGLAEHFFEGYIEFYERTPPAQGVRPGVDRIPGRHPDARAQGDAGRRAGRHRPLLTTRTPRAPTSVTSRTCSPPPPRGQGVGLALIEAVTMGPRARL